MDVFSQVIRRANVRENYVLRNLIGGFKTLLQNRTTQVYFIFLIFILLLALFGPHLAPYDYQERQLDENNQLQRLEEPSLAHPLGTNDAGQDVLSRVMWGARPTAITGLLGGSIIITVGLTIGVISGYVGGRVDDLLMRFTDLIYSVPVLPFALVLIAFLGTSFINSIMIIGFILWRSSARVLRSQVLQIKERPFVMSARASGASAPRIIFKHILPNIAPMAVLFFALGVGYSILIQAGLTFLGATDPFLPSWGNILRNAFRSGVMDLAWWWTLPPGLLISITVLATFMVGRGYESAIGSDTESLTEMTQ